MSHYQFFSDDKALFQHYNQKHYPCKECHYGFVGTTMIELINHKTKEHSLREEHVNPVYSPPSPQPPPTTKKKENKHSKSLPSLPGIGSQSSNLSTHKPSPPLSLSQSVIRFSAIREKYSLFIENVLSRTDRGEKVELANIIIELGIVAVYLKSDL